MKACRAVLSSSSSSTTKASSSSISASGRKAFAGAFLAAGFLAVKGASAADFLELAGKASFAAPSDLRAACEEAFAGSPFLKMPSFGAGFEENLNRPKTRINTVQ
jgi:hypothetical protein